MSQFPEEAEKYKKEYEKIIKLIDERDNISILKKQKTEIDDKIDKKKQEIKDIDVNILDSILIPINDCKIEKIAFKKKDIDGCWKILKVKIKDHVVDEKWGVLISPFFVEDGEYYLLMSRDDYTFYEMYLNNGDVNCLWEFEYKKIECLSYDDCWYKWNSDRRKERLCTYCFPCYGYDNFLYTFCEVCYNNNCYENNEKFVNERDNIEREYKERFERITNPKYITCSKCKKVIREYIFNGWLYGDVDVCSLCSYECK